MPNFTPNIGLEKPLGTEFYDVGVPNSNMDKLDAKIGSIDTSIEKVMEQKPLQLLSFNREASLSGYQTLTGFNDIPKALTVYANRANTQIFSTGYFDGEEQISWSSRYDGLSSAYADAVIEFVESANDYIVAGAIINDDKTVTLNWIRTGNPTGNINIFVVAHYLGEVTP